MKNVLEKVNESKERVEKTSQFKDRTRSNEKKGGDSTRQTW